MRVFFCKFHCCFCKPSPHLLSPSPLKLENTPHAPETLSSVPDGVGQLSDGTIEVKEILDGNQGHNFPKSCLKKPSSKPGVQKEVEKAKVLWMDFIGKELVEVKEFEPSESGDSDDEDEGSQGCVCVIQ